MTKENRAEGKKKHLFLAESDSEDEERLQKEDYELRKKIQKMVEKNRQEEMQEEARAPMRQKKKPLFLSESENDDDISFAISAPSKFMAI